MREEVKRSRRGRIHNKRILFFFVAKGDTACVPFTIKLSTVGTNEPHYQTGPTSLFRLELDHTQPRVNLYAIHLSRVGTSAPQHPPAPCRSPGFHFPQTTHPGCNCLYRPPNAFVSSGTQCKLLFQRSFSVSIAATVIGRPLDCLCTREAWEDASCALLLNDVQYI